MAYTEDEERLKALAEHLGISYFEHNGKIYEGDEDDIREAYKDSLLNNEETEEDEVTEEGFEEYLNSEATLLEDEISDDGDNEFSHGNRSYRVLTDSEADEAWEKELKSFAEECILSEIPQQYRQYFNMDKWVDDAKSDGRGHSLDKYSGNEAEENGFYIYRTN